MAYYILVNSTGHHSSPSRALALAVTRSMILRAHGVKLYNTGYVGNVNKAQCLYKQRSGNGCD